MSGPYYTSRLAGPDYNLMDTLDMRRRVRRALEEGLHGLCFSPYEPGQRPGDELSEAQVRRRLEIIQPHCEWVRSFSCTEGNQHIPRVAREMGLRTLVGAWLGPDREKNEVEIQQLVELAQAGHVNVAAVGNEVLYREDLPAEELLELINRVRDALPMVQVGYVDAYYHFTDYPEITEACDVVLANCYPFWEGCPLEHSLVYMKQMYQQALRAARGKQVIITETGWPSRGANFKGAYPSERAAMSYFLNAQAWSKEEGIDLFYFSSFDEAWKIATEGDVGGCWGLWDQQEKLKFGL